MQTVIEIGIGVVFVMIVLVVFSLVSISRN